MLIGICGKKRSGKSTAGKYLCDKYNFKSIYFAGYLKEICHNLFGTNPALDRAVDLSSRDREILQKVGTDFMRSIDPDCWVKYTTKVMKELLEDKKHLVVSDVRFENEARAIKDLGGELWKLRHRLPDFDSFEKRRQDCLLPHADRGRIRRLGGDQVSRCRPGAGSYADRQGVVRRLWDERLRLSRRLRHPRNAPIYLQPARRVQSPGENRRYAAVKGRPGPIGRVCGQRLS